MLLYFVELWCFIIWLFLELDDSLVEEDFIDDFIIDEDMMVFEEMMIVDDLLLSRVLFVDKISGFLVRDSCLFVVDVLVEDFKVMVLKCKVCSVVLWVYYVWYNNKDFNLVVVVSLLRDFFF